MSLTLFIAASGLAVTSVMAVRDHRSANAARRGLLDDCGHALNGTQIHHGPDGFPKLSGFHLGHEIRAELLLDTMTIRRLPQLWLSTTLIAPNHGLPRLAVLVRPAGTEFYSLTSYLEHRLDTPSNFPHGALVRGDDGADRLLNDLSGAFVEILSDPRVKEIAISERGVRIVRQAAEGKRGEYLLLRQSVFETAALQLENFETVLAELKGLQAMTSSYSQARAA